MPNDPAQDRHSSAPRRVRRAVERLPAQCPLADERLRPRRARSRRRQDRSVSSERPRSSRASSRSAAWIERQSYGGRSPQRFSFVTSDNRLRHPGPGGPASWLSQIGQIDVRALSVRGRVVRVPAIGCPAKREPEDGGGRAPARRAACCSSRPARLRTSSAAAGSWCSGAAPRRRTIPSTPSTGRLGDDEVGTHGAAVADEGADRGGEILEVALRFPGRRRG